MCRYAESDDAARWLSTISAQQLDALDPQTRQAVQSLLAQVQQRDTELTFKQALIDKLTHEARAAARPPAASRRAARTA